MYRNWNNALKALYIFVLLMLITHQTLVDAAAVAEESEEDVLQKIQLDDDVNDVNLAKRAWKQLQNGWGKRNINEELHYAQILQDYPESLRSYDYEATTRLKPFNLMLSDADGDETGVAVEKRAWKQLRGAGKRDWNQLRGTGWGKREPGNWNNLRGLWGKRSAPQSWNRLSNAWGK